MKAGVVFFILFGLLNLASAQNIQFIFPSNEAAFTEAAQKLNQILPSKLKQTIRSPIKIEFSDFGVRSLNINCDFQNNENLVKPEKLKNSLPMISKLRDSGIVLHSDLKGALLAGENRSQTYACGHKNYYKLALASIIKEVAVIYDRNPPATAERNSQLEDCRYSRENNQAGTTPACLKAAQFDRSVSTRFQYQSLAYARDRVIQNYLPTRTFDPTELSSLENHFAINLGYFLLDDEYACRRPSLNRFFSRFFQIQSPNQCQMNRSVLLSGSQIGVKELATLDPKRIYQIHYFLADKGQDISSRWGHTMLRLVICSPHRKEVGPECMKDDASHLIISFRANVQDLSIDVKKGLTGDYPSRLFVLRLQEVMDEYNYGEIRDIKSVPLKLTDEQKEAMIDRIIEYYWEYTGRYYFLSNNCTSETFDVLKYVFQNDNFYLESIRTPLGLYDLLKENKLIDTSVLNNREQARRDRYLYASLHDNFRLAEAHLRQAGIEIKDWLSYARETSPEQRMTNFLHKIPLQNGEVFTNENAQIKRLNSFISSALLIERYALRSIGQQLRESLMEDAQLAEKNEGNFSAEDKDSLTKLAQFARLGMMSSPIQTINQPGAGIPQAFKLEGGVGSGVNGHQFQYNFEDNDLLHSYLKKRRPGLLRKREMIEYNNEYFWKIYSTYDKRAD